VDAESLEIENGALAFWNTDQLVRVVGDYLYCEPVKEIP